MDLILDTGPAMEPVSLEEAKTHLRVDVSDDDALIENLISASRRTFEQINRRTLYTTTWRLKLDGWPRQSYITLPRPPLASVTSISVKDQEGAATTWNASNYIVESERTPGRVYLAYGQSWPDQTLYPTGAITVTYVAGWATVDAIPAEYKAAILLLLGHLYENREAVVVTGAVPKEIPLAWESIVLMDRVYY